MKGAVTSALVLIYPDFSVPFKIECDASGKGVGAVLMQQQRPIAYFSKAFLGANLSKSTYEKELMAVVLAVRIGGITYWGVNSLFLMIKRA